MILVPIAISVRPILFGFGGESALDHLSRSFSYPGQAKKELKAGNFREALLCLLRIKDTKPRKPPPDVKILLSIMFAACYVNLDDYESALPHSRRAADLQQQHAPRSFEHALALKALAQNLLSLQQDHSVRKPITKALAIMDELGLSNHEEYGAMLIILGKLDSNCPQKALVSLDKAKIVLEQHKEGKHYGSLLVGMSICRHELQQWNEARACYQEAVEHFHGCYGNDHPEYAIVLSSFAVFYGELKQFEEETKLLEEAIAIEEKVFGKKHDRTLSTAAYLAKSRRDAKRHNREKINVGHDFRMCNHCGNIAKLEENIGACNGCCRAWYCNNECQLQHWPAHKPTCNVCAHCDLVVERPAKIFECSRCMAVKYCGRGMPTPKLE